MVCPTNPSFFQTQRTSALGLPAGKAGRRRRCIARALFPQYARSMKFGTRRADRLSPEEREIVDRFERGAIDASEAGRLLIASVRTVAEAAPTDAAADESETAEPDPASNETPEETAARLLVERIARDTYDDSTT
jgi:hypothetical protein